MPAADLVLVDPNESWVVSAQESPSTQGYTPFEGTELSARVKQTWLAIILSSSQLIGMLTGGYLADRLGASDLRWYVWVPSLAILVSTPMFALTFLTQNPTVAFLSLFPGRENHTPGVQEVVMGCAGIRAHA